MIVLSRVLAFLCNTFVGRSNNICAITAKNIRIEKITSFDILSVKIFGPLESIKNTVNASKRFVILYIQLFATSLIFDSFINKAEAIE